MAPFFLVLQKIGFAEGLSASSLMLLGRPMKELRNLHNVLRQRAAAAADAACARMFPERT